MNPLQRTYAHPACEPAAESGSDSLERLLREVQAMLRQGFSAHAFAKCAVLEDGVCAALDVIASEHQAPRPPNGAC